ncbi:MAG: FecR family protein [Cyclobacteriaceae bacterium]
MTKESDDSELVTKWLSNKLSPEELAEFQKSSRYTEYQKIFNEVESWIPPTVLTDDGFSELIKKRDKVKVVQWHQRSSLKIAASLLVVLSLVLLVFRNDSMTTVATGIAESREVLLPDSSIVYLASSSILSYNEESWNHARKLDLKGSAFFEVEKGSPFEVTFTQGVVQVLGTSFEVKSFADYGSVACYEGEVVVESGETKKKLRKGMGVRLENEKTPESFEFRNISWSKDISRYQSAPLSIVFERLAAEFDLEIASGSIDLTRTFTGAYSNMDIVSALNIVSSSMQLTYKRSNGAVTFVEL